jgi:hypothetical protein
MCKSIESPNLDWVHNTSWADTNVDILVHPLRIWASGRCHSCQVMREEKGMQRSDKRKLTEIYLLQREVQKMVR